MRMTRRALLTAGAGLVAALHPAAAMARSGLHAQAHALDEGWLTTAGLSEGFGAFHLGADFSAEDRMPTPDRLHGIEPSPRDPLAVAVGRRPGHVALVFDRRRGGRIAQFGPGAGRVFSGHGRFSPDGARFLTNEIERGVETGATRTMGQGIVAVRRVDAGFEIVDEWRTGGDGPHDLMRGGPHLVVANGGIEPNTPEARDADVTGSTITLLDPSSGAARGEGRLSDDLSSLSLRHLARDEAGRMVVAAQDLLKDGVTRPLVFAIGGDGHLSPFEAPEGELLALRGYVGSITFDASGGFIACSSPRGGRIAIWRRDGRYIGAVPLTDGCGLAPTAEGGRFLATSGYGEVVLIAVQDTDVAIISRRTGGPRFDNHMVRA